MRASSDERMEKPISEPTRIAPSLVRKEAFGSVTIYWLDREAARQQVRAAAQQLVAARPEVVAVYLFGSLATNKATPRSDADILIVLRESDQPVWFKRAYDYFPYFAQWRCPPNCSATRSTSCRARSSRGTPCSTLS